MKGLLIAVGAKLVLGFVGVSDGSAQHYGCNSPYASEPDVMQMLRMFFAAALTMFSSLATSSAFAQYGFHVDHHDHVIKDSHGHVIGRYHHDVIHCDAQRIVPHLSTVNHGTYYRQNGQSF